MDLKENRGNLYTCRGGFLDLSHTRDMADLSADLMIEILQAVQKRAPKILFQGNEKNSWKIVFDYENSTLNTPAQEFSLSLDAAIETAHLMGVFHEMASWYGLTAGEGTFPEQQSAFTYEDLVSHALGFIAARKALADPERDFDDAMTLYLQEAIDALIPVSPQQHRAAAALAKERGWWREEKFSFSNPLGAGGLALKRFTDLGLKGTITPWVLEDFAPCQDKTPMPLAVPKTTDTRFSVSIQLSGLQPTVRENLMEKLDLKEEQNIEPARDFPVLIEDIEGALEKTFGPDFNHP